MRQTAPAPEVLPALTSLRFFAALMIFTLHLNIGAHVAGIDAIEPGLYHGVSFFFVLSGFVLTYANAGRAVSWRRFYLARFARIAPLHLFCLALLIAALPLPLARWEPLGPWEAGLALASKAAMLDAWVPVHGYVYSWNFVSWSISVEMGMYAAFPLLLVAVSRRPLTTLAATLALSFAVIAAAAAAGLPLMDTDPHALTLVDLAACFPPARAFEFALGVATCLAWRRWIAPARLPLWAWTALEASALAATVAFVFIAVPALTRETHGVAYAWLRASGSCWLFAALMAATAGGRGLVGRVLALRPLVALGEASFAFYLVHRIVIHALAFHFGRGLGVWPPFTLALALAFVLHYAVEIPMRRRVLALGAPRPEAASPVAA